MGNMNKIFVCMYVRKYIFGICFEYIHYVVGFIRPWVCIMYVYVYSYK